MKLEKESPIWGLMILPVLFAWVVGMRVVFVLIGFNPSHYTGARGMILLALAAFGTLISVVVAYENTPERSGT